MLEPGVDFLNHGSFGAVPRVVFAAQTEWRRKIEAAPVEVIARRRLELIDAAKEPVGRWLGMRPDDFGLVTNATEGVNAVLHSLRFSPDDELLTTSHVYNAVRQAMKFTCARSGAAYREVDVPLPVLGPEGVVEAVLGGGGGGGGGGGAGAGGGRRGGNGGGVGPDAAGGEGSRDVAGGARVSAGADRRAVGRAWRRCAGRRGGWAGDGAAGRDADRGGV